MKTLVKIRAKDNCGENILFFIFVTTINEKQRKSINI